VQAKDQLIQECKNIIMARDNSLQKFIKLNGSLVQNPKEDPYSKIIMQQFEKCQILQEEKIGLVDKAMALVCRLLALSLHYLYSRLHRQTATSKD